MVVIAAVVVGAILWKVIPTFAVLFEGLGATLPMPTRIVIAMSNSLVQFMPFVLGGGFALAFALQAVLRDTSRAPCRRWDDVEAADPWPHTA